MTHCRLLQHCMIFRTAHLHAASGTCWSNLDSKVIDYLSFSTLYLHTLQRKLLTTLEFSERNSTVSLHWSCMNRTYKWNVCCSWYSRDYFCCECVRYQKGKNHMAALIWCWQCFMWTLVLRGHRLWNRDDSGREKLLSVPCMFYNFWVLAWHWSAVRWSV